MSASLSSLEIVLAAEQSIHEQRVIELTKNNSPI
jgi:hypothetical protein